MKALMILTMMVLTLASTTLAAKADDLPVDPMSQPEETISYNYDWEVDASITYSTGNFGTDTTTNTVYIPLTITRYFSEWYIAATVPYIHIESEAQVTTVAGRPLRTRTTTSTSKISEGGIGDIILEGGYTLLTEENSALNLTTYATIKFPTADEDKGLGTGEFDETVGLSANKSLSDKWFIDLGVSYTFIGEPDGTDLNNIFSFSAGPGYQLTQNTNITLLYQESTALVDDTSNSRNIVLDMHHRLNDQIGIMAGLDAGLSDSSSDFAITAGGNVSF